MFGCINDVQYTIRQFTINFKSRVFSPKLKYALHGCMQYIIESGELMNLAKRLNKITIQLLTPAVLKQCQTHSGAYEPSAKRSG
jgi:hypothetical protein